MADSELKTTDWTPKEEEAAAAIREVTPCTRLMSLHAARAAISVERLRVAAIVRHHMESHLASAKIHSSPIDIARHEQAAAALETVWERIEDP